MNTHFTQIEKTEINMIARVSHQAKIYSYMENRLTTIIEHIYLTFSSYGRTLRLNTNFFHPISRQCGRRTTETRIMDTQTGIRWHSRLLQTGTKRTLGKGRRSRTIRRDDSRHRHHASVSTAVRWVRLAASLCHRNGMT